MAELLEQVAKLDEVNKSISERNKVLAEENENLKKYLKQPDYNAAGGSPGKLFATARDPKEEGQWSFKSIGEFAYNVAKSRGGAPNERLQKAYSAEHVTKAAQGMGELIGSDGGFLVPPTFSSSIFERIYKTNDLLSRTDSYTTAGNTMVFPRNAESSRVAGSRWGGVQAYWLQEGGAGTLSKPTFGRLTLTLHKLLALAAVTSEMIDDSGTVMGQYLNRVFSEEIAFQAGNAIINGTGAGQPLGLLNSPAAVSVSKETGQAAATINSQNIVNMRARLFYGNRGNAVWLINQDVGPALHLMTLGIGTAGIATYMPPGGLSGLPYATILGMPVIETEFNATLGTVGDIILVDLSQYVTITKGNVDAQTSMHLYFNTDEQAFRVTYRMDGQPWMSSALTPFKGSNTQSCIVTLATRA